MLPERVAKGSCLTLGIAGWRHMFLWRRMRKSPPKNPGPIKWQERRSGGGGHDSPAKCFWTCAKERILPWQDLSRRSWFHVVAKKHVVHGVFWKSWRINENQIEFWGCIYLQVSWVPIASPSQYSPFHPRILMAEPHCLGMTGMNFQASNKPI